MVSRKARMDVIFVLAMTFPHRLLETAVQNRVAEWLVKTASRKIHMDAMFVNAMIHQLHLLLNMNN
jgi:hypothetical protein